MEAPSCHAHTADAGHVSLPRNAGSAWLCSRQFSNSFPGTANVEPVAESSIFAFYGCPSLPLHEQCTLDGAAEELQLDTLSATPNLTSSGVSKISSSNCLDSQDFMSSTLHGGLCLEGEALPRSLGSRHNQSKRPSLDDDTSLLFLLPAVKAGSVRRYTTFSQETITRSSIVSPFPTHRPNFAVSNIIDHMSFCLDAYLS